jgi:putative methionine-R-sulfoxide reductase with GAF domain
VLRNCQLYEESRAAQRKVETLLDIVHLLHSDPNTNSLIFTLTNRAHTLVDGDRSTLYLVHRPTQTLVVQQGNVDIKIPMSKGLAGHVASTGQLVNIPDCYAETESRFDQSIDKKTGYHTKAMLCMPIFGPRPGLKEPTPADVIGVLQLINKKDTASIDTFVEADERLLRTLLDLSGPILAASSFFSQQSVPQTEAERMKHGSAPSPRTQAASNAGAGESKSKSPNGAAAGTGGGKQRTAGMRRVTETDGELEEDVKQARQMVALGEDDEEGGE